MTIAELIKELKVHPSNQKVECRQDGSYVSLPIKAVEFDEALDSAVCLILETKLFR